MDKICSKIAFKSFLKIYVIVSFLLFANTFFAHSQTGVLDVTFGNKGKVVTALGPNHTYLYDFVIQDDGKIVALAEYHNLQNSDSSKYGLIRFNSDGSVDKTYGVDGVVTTDQYVYWHYARLQIDGKLVVNGSDKSSFENFIIRLNIDGSIDSTFGKKGIISISLPPFYSYFETKNLLIKSDGKIVLTGAARDSLYVTRKGAYIGIVQLNSDGSFDSTFGTNGYVFTPNWQLFTFICEQADGKIILGGDSTNSGTSSDSSEIYGSTLRFRRFNTNGSIDSSFGTQGIMATAFVRNGFQTIIYLAVTNTGQIDVLTNMNEGLENYTRFLKFSSTGAVDSTFGTNGIINTKGRRGNSHAFTGYIQPDGKMFVVGSIDSELSGYRDFLLLRFDAEGSPDSTFGKQGIVTTDFEGYDDGSYYFARQRDGKIILGGEVNNSSKVSRVALARYDLNEPLKYNTIAGSVFIDKNQNSIKDASETFANNANIITTKAGIDTVLINVSNGKFTVDIDTGTYTTKVNPYLPYYTTVPSEHTTANTTYFNSDTVAFALQPIAGKRDVAVNLIPITVARPGFDATYKIMYSNQGTDTITSGRIELIKNSKLTLLSAEPAVTSVKGDTLTWNYTSLTPMDTAGIVIHFNIDPPPSVNFGDTLRSVANIYPVATDLTPLDNTSAMLQEVVGSYDPNDKTENHAGSVKVAQVQQGEDLQYTIRFQNTGTDTAFNVFIRDTLSNKVDWNTLKIISSSHNFQLTVNEGNKCSWAFKNINLVDSNKNELLSHGYIVYSVEAKTSLVAGETIDNTAHIYFDYNLPVQTNTERTTVENRALPVKLVTFTAKRSGRTNVLQWLTNNEINLDRFEIERSENGATFTRIGSVKAGVNKYTFTDNTPAKTINYYRLKMLDKDGKFEYSAVRTVNNSSSFYVSIYPNPVTEKLIVQTDSDKETAIQLQVIGMDGKLMLQKQTKIHAGQNVQTVDVSAMQAGSYLLKIVQSDKETSVIKFQKF